MLKTFSLAGICAAAALTLGTAAEATTVTDPVGDFISGYTGPQNADLDVVSFSVSYNAALSVFLIQSTMAGDIGFTTGGFYAIGVNTGTGPSNFAGIGRPDVRFNRVISVRNTGVATIGGVPLPDGSLIIDGATFSLVVPLSALPTTGFAAVNYGFNIWPRSGPGGTEVISDFAPENATISAVPEPATWASMMLGLGLSGAALRRRRRASGLPHPA